MEEHEYIEQCLIMKIAKQAVTLHTLHWGIYSPNPCNWMGYD